ncbi:MAG TPA: DUF6502 family protein [Candidatus Kryptonia bacterium]|nr:DUF6502 family protein [Candidatus Kryptonia bacterium]
MLPRSQKALFLAAIRRLLRPVVRQLIAYGVTFPALTRLLKEVYVEVAEQQFALPFKRQTDSRIALMTGLNRKEVAQLRATTKSARTREEVALEDTIVTHAIGRWMAGPPYAAPDGHPRRLRYESPNPRDATFARLVRELAIDLPVRAVLDELLRVGAVELLPDGDVVLQREVHVPLTDAEAKFALLGSDPAEVFASIVHNIERADAPWLQRKVVYDNIGSDALADLREEARRVGEEFVRRANALLASYDRDRRPDAPAGTRSRVVLGAYYFEEPAAKSTAPPAAQETTKHTPRPPGRIRRSR